MVRRCERGLTLLEVVIVMAFAGIFTLIGMPSLMHIRNQMAVDAGAAELVAVLRSMQAESTSYAADRLMTIDVARGSYSYSRLGSDDEVEVSLPAGAVVLPPPRTTFPVTNGRVVLNWQPTGWGSAGTVAVSAPGGKVRRVVVQVATGRIVLR